MGKLSQVVVLGRGARRGGAVDSLQACASACYYYVAWDFFFLENNRRKSSQSSDTAEKGPLSPRGLYVAQMEEVGNLFRFNVLLESPPCLVGEETETQRDTGGRRSRETC